MIAPTCCQKAYNKQWPGEFHTPSKGSDRSSAPKGCNLTGAVRDALSAGAARPKPVFQHFSPSHCKILPVVLCYW